jgi:hypothetical protein
MASRLGGVSVEAPRITQLQQDKDFMAASIKDQKAYLKDTDPDFAKASPLDQDAYLGHITGVTGPTVEIDDGHTVQFIQNIPQEGMNKTAGAYYTALRQILMRSRAVVVSLAFAFWVIPAIVLYALGWAVHWVRSGFRTSTI